MKTESDPNATADPTLDEVDVVVSEHALQRFHQRVVGVRKSLDYAISELSRHLAKSRLAGSEEIAWIPPFTHNGFWLVLRGHAAMPCVFDADGDLVARTCLVFDGSGVKTTRASASRLTDSLEDPAFLGDLLAEDELNRLQERRALRNLAVSSFIH